MLDEESQAEDRQNREVPCEAEGRALDKPAEESQKEAHYEDDALCKLNVGVDLVPQIVQVVNVAEVSGLNFHVRLTCVQVSLCIYRKQDWIVGHNRAFCHAFVALHLDSEAIPGVLILVAFVTITEYN